MLYTKARKYNSLTREIQRLEDLRNTHLRICQDIIKKRDELLDERRLLEPEAMAFLDSVLRDCGVKQPNAKDQPAGASPARPASTCSTEEQ